MVPRRRIQDQLEAELRQVEAQFRTATETISAEWPGPARADVSSEEFHDLVAASEAKEMAYETRSRLARRLAAIREALRRLREGTYGRCEDCNMPIPEKRLLALPETALCVTCQDRHEQLRGGPRASSPSG